MDSRVRKYERKNKDGTKTSSSELNLPILGEKSPIKTIINQYKNLNLALRRESRQ
jgi:hypothetical protein